MSVLSIRNITLHYNFCFVFFPFLFQGDIKDSKNCHPSVMSFFFPCLSTFCSSFCYGRIMCVSYKYIKQRDASFEFSSILLTVNLSKHLIMVESFENSYSLSDQFCDFQCLFFPFSAIEYG